MSNSGEEFLRLVKRHADEIAATMAVRTTQTNEPARCATLLPVLAHLPQALALLEVGASAGLCLLPDYYAYDYGGHSVEPSATCGAEPPRFGSDRVGYGAVPFLTARVFDWYNDVSVSGAAGH